MSKSVLLMFSSRSCIVPHFTFRLLTNFEFTVVYVIREKGIVETTQFHYYLHIPNIKLWRTQWHPTPVLLPGKSHGWRSLVGCSPWGRWESDTTERLHFHFSLSFIGEGNGSPLQCFCLENPRDGGAWWAAVYGVAQSRTRLKRLSSSSSSMNYLQVREGANLNKQ